MTGSLQTELADCAGETDGVELLAVDGQRNDERAGLDVLGNALALFRFDVPFHSLGGMVGRFLVGYLKDVELAVAPKPFGIFRDGVAQIPFFHLANADNVDIHPAFTILFSQVID